MSKGSNPKMVTTSSSAEPSDFIKPYYTQAIDTAQDLFEGTTPNYFPNATYVGFAPETEASLNLATARALAGNPLLNQAQTQSSNILSGQYLDPTTNPYTQALYNKMAVRWTMCALRWKGLRRRLSRLYKVLRTSLGYRMS